MQGGNSHNFIMNQPFVDLFFFVECSNSTMRLRSNDLEVCKYGNYYGNYGNYGNFYGYYYGNYGNYGNYSNDFKVCNFCK